MELLARDLARWLAAPIRLACPHQPRLPPPASPAPMLRSRASPGSDARHWSPDVILGFTEYALSFAIYIRLSFSLSLLFRQSLLYNSQFNISIRTRLISTGTELYDDLGDEVEGDDRLSVEEVDD